MEEGRRWPRRQSSRYVGERDVGWEGELIGPVECRLERWHVDDNDGGSRDQGMKQGMNSQQVQEKL